MVPARTGPGPNTGRQRPSLAPIDLGDIDDGLGEGLRRLLRQIVPDAACDEPVLVSPGEFLRIRTGLRMRCTVGIAFEGDGGDADGGTRGKPFLQVVIF